MKLYWCRATPVACGFSSTAELSNRLCDQQNLKYLLSGHIQKTFVNSWFSKVPRYPITFKLCNEGHILIARENFLIIISGERQQN